MRPRPQGLSGCTLAPSKSAIASPLSPRGMVGAICCHDYMGGNDGPFQGTLARTTCERPCHQLSRFVPTIAFVGPSSGRASRSRCARAGAFTHMAAQIARRTSSRSAGDEGSASTLDKGQDGERSLHHRRRPGWSIRSVSAASRASAMVRSFREAVASQQRSRAKERHGSSHLNFGLPIFRRLHGRPPK